MEVAKLILRTFIGLGVVLALGVLSYNLFQDGNGWGWVAAGGSVLLGMELWESLQPDHEQRLRQASKAKNKARSARKKETARNNAATKRTSSGSTTTRQLARKPATKSSYTAGGTRITTTSTRGKNGARTSSTSIQRKPAPRKPRTVRV